MDCLISMLDEKHALAFKPALEPWLIELLTKEGITFIEAEYSDCMI
jgi:N-dimethylarginine dimethylaminohydrolase